MENNFFHYSFEPNSKTVDEMILSIKTIFHNLNIEVIEIINEFYEDEGELHNISFLTKSKKYRFTYDDYGEPCVDICDKEGEIMKTIRPKDYDELKNSIK